MTAAFFSITVPKPSLYEDIWALPGKKKKKNESAKKAILLSLRKSGTTFHFKKETSKFPYGKFST